MSDDAVNTDGSGEQDSKSKPPQLLEIELRVLGVLMEKELTTPDAYPLTMNSLINGCNQKSNREPVSNYHQGQIGRALMELEGRYFVRREQGTRADRYEQKFISRLGLGKKQQAALCVMMLRGPQTLSELKNRTQRMVDFPNRDDLENCIDKLCTSETPCAIRMGQQPGQREERIGHLFAGIPLVTPTPSSSAIKSSKPGSSELESNESNASHVLDIGQLNARILDMEGEIAALKERLNSLYNLTGHSSS
ncbi:MAG: YceH family protein [Granulosicoccus sp.]